MDREKGIYVEILIRGPLEQVWHLTQDPGLHERWDLRFSSIRYLPRAAQDEPQRFRYTTRLGMGLEIDGEGESTGHHNGASGLRTSALKFWSADPKSLIAEGSGYWRYVPLEGATRFLTWYDYRTRFGNPGRLFDRIVFRPLLAWATAWSFDRLRLHIEQGVSPETTLRFAAVHALARIGIAFTWFWQGLIPKLVFAHAEERTMLAAAGLPQALLPWLGALELALAVLTLATWRRRSFFLFNVVAMIVALDAVALHSPEFLSAAFNPVTLNVGMIFLSLAGYFAAPLVPSAARCLRKPPEENR